MSEQQKRELLWLIGFVAVTGVLVIAVVGALMRRWRYRLLSGPPRDAGRDIMPDLWKAGGQRLTRQLDRERRAGNDDDVDPFEGGAGGTGGNGADDEPRRGRDKDRRAGNDSRNNPQANEPDAGDPETDGPSPHDADDDDSPPPPPRRPR